MDKSEFIARTGIDAKVLDGFAEEMLSEMELDDIEGGKNFCVNINLKSGCKCDSSTKIYYKVVCDCCYED